MVFSGVIFCFVRWVQALPDSLGFALAMRGCRDVPDRGPGAKSMTEKTTEGHGNAGKGSENRGSAGFSPARLGLLPCGCGLARPLPFSFHCNACPTIGGDAVFLWPILVPPTPSVYKLPYWLFSGVPQTPGLFGCHCFL